MNLEDIILWYSIGVIFGTLGSHFIGEPLIGFMVGIVFVVLVIVIKIIRFVSTRKHDG